MSNYTAADYKRAMAIRERQQARRAILAVGAEAVITDAVIGRVIAPGIAPGVRVRITEVIEPAPRPANPRFRRDVPQVRYAATLPSGPELEFFADELAAP